MDDEWTDWIEHDGKGCPCVGAFVRCAFRSGGVSDHRAGVFRHGDPALVGSSWHWGTGWDDIIRYRIRKPRAMAQIRALLENLPERVDA